MKTKYIISLELLDPERKVKVIKYVRSLLDVGLKRAKEIVEGLHIPLKSLGLEAFIGLTHAQESIKIHLFVHDEGRIVQEGNTTRHILPDDPKEAAVVLQLLWHKERMSALYVQLAEIKGLKSD